jgi:hypothetical protein
MLVTYEEISRNIQWAEDSEYMQTEINNLNFRVMHPVAREPIKHFFVDLRSQQYLWFNVYYFHYMFRPLSAAIFKWFINTKYFLKVTSHDYEVVMEVIHIKPQILLQTEVYKKVFEK